MQGAGNLLLLVLVFVSSCCGTSLRPVPSWLFRTNVRAQGLKPSRPPATDVMIKEPILPRAVRQLCPPDWDRLRCFDAYMSMLVNMSRLKKVSQGEEGGREHIKKGAPMIKLPCGGDKLECFNRYLLIWLQMVDGIEKQQTMLNLPKRKSVLGAMHMALETPCLPNESSLVCVERILKDEEATAKFLKSMRAQAGEDEHQKNDTNNEDAVDQLECEKNPNKKGCNFKNFKNKYNRHRRAMIDICNSFTSTRECFENYLNFYAEVYSTKSQHLGKKHFVGRDTSAALKLLQSSKDNNLPATKTQ